MPSMKDVLGIILGGGCGSRLHPPTAMCSKAAVPIAGKYRLIDIPIINCINSGIYRVSILTQFNSVSLSFQTLEIRIAPNWSSLVYSFGGTQLRAAAGGLTGAHA